MAAKQLRLRNVLRSEVRVFVDQPEAFIVEASDRLKVGKWEVSYPELPAQFALAGVDPAGPNHWSKVYDFSPNSDGKEHWSFLPDQETLRPSLLQPLPSGLCGGEVMELVGRAGTSPGKQVLVRVRARARVS